MARLIKTLPLSPLVPSLSYHINKWNNNNNNQDNNQDNNNNNQDNNNNNQDHNMQRERRARPVVLQVYECGNDNGPEY